MAALKFFVAAAAVAFLFELSAAANFTVGNPGGGWIQGSPLAAWAQAQTFTQGDNLIFSYDASHNVLEVNKANYDSCTAAGPIKTYTTGNDVIPLSTTGKRYFICGKPGHCNPGGMKVEIDTVAASGPSASPPGTPPATPSTPGTPPSTPTGTSPPPSKSGASSHGLQAKAAAGFGLGMIMLLAL